MANKTLHPKKIFDDLISLLYPRLCMLCDAQVQKGDYMCISCENNLPTTDYHTLVENPVTEKFYGRVKIEFGAAYYIFGPATKTQKLIHELKYNNKPQLGKYIGRIYGDQLKESPISAEKLRLGKVAKKNSTPVKALNSTPDLISGSSCVSSLIFKYPIPPPA